ncbi:hypothetical protein OG530_19170 [Streptomyces decoyicus]|uniref:hypothetical protein n=1 Tax=Streptomyces decoyicus TaxID=249567 RepID=UPI002E198527
MNACELCGRPPGEATPYLCEGCARSTTARLDRMGTLYAALEPFLGPAGRRGRTGHGGKTEAPLPVEERVLTLRGPGGMAGVLEDWRAAMQRDRGWGPPAVGGTLDHRVVAAARGLSMNMDWVASSWPLAGTFAEEMRDLERSVESIVDPVDPQERPRRLGYCPTKVDGVLCGAVIRLFHGQGSATCQWCGTEWGPTRWLELAQAQAEFESVDAA